MSTPTTDTEEKPYFKNGRIPTAKEYHNALLQAFNYQEQEKEQQGQGGGSN
jgi:hypothetical protein